MSLHSKIAFISAVVCSTGMAIVLVQDMINQTLRVNVLVNALEIATGVWWLIWAVFWVGDNFTKQVNAAEQKLNAAREVRRLKVVPRRD